VNRLAIVTVAVVALTGIGCVPPQGPSASYDITEMRPEQFKGQLDAWWFARHIRGSKGEIVAGEIVYCPLMNPPPWVCRTAVVWELNKSLMMGHQIGNSVTR
jgi:hypothetical protein